MVKTLGLMLAIAAGAAAWAAAADGEMPEGWFKAGSRPKEYDMGLDPKIRHDGGASAFIRCNTQTPSGFGTLMQTADAADYTGKRVRMSGHVRSEGVSPGWAGLWLRVDGSPGTTRATSTLAFDNMQDRAIRGTTDWTAYDIVLDVPPNALTLNFGLLLDGPGHAWIDNLKFEVVGSDVPVTGKLSTPPPAPQNLSFDKLLQPLGTLRTIVSAQAYYKATKPAEGYACEFAPLVSARALSASRTWNAVMDGYKYTIECPKRETPQTSFRAAAVPASGSGPVFCTKDGIRVLKGQDTAAACFEKGEPQE